MGQLFADTEPVIGTSAVDGAEVAHYRRTSPFTIACLIFGIIALVGLATVQDVGFLPYLTVPGMGILLGLRGLQCVKRYDETGKTPAMIGMALCAVCMAGAWPLQKWLDANETPPGYKRIDYAQLQAEEGKGPVPDSAKALDGQRVFIKGFVYPGRQKSGIKEFVLCRDNGTCCFGGQPKLNDMIQVTLKEPLTLEYDTTMRQLAGTFRVSNKPASEGLGQVLYELEADFLR